MEEALPPPSPKTLGASDAGSPDQPCSSHRRPRSRSLSRSPSPSPRSSAVPFSWERSPGIPKELSAAATAALDPVLLPLPPPLRCHSDLSAPWKRRSASGRPSSAASADPFAAALQLCVRGLPHDDADDFWGGAPDASAAAAASRRSAASIADRLRFLDLYSSCKATCTVVDATIRLPRTGSSGFLGRRSASGSI